MSPTQPGNMQRRNPAAERDRLVTPPQRLLNRLKPFNFSDPKLGVRRSDVAAFLAIASATETIILLRASNPASLPYIGVKGFTAKAIDCKAKTAKANDLIDGYIVECAGLVVDPRRLSPKVFNDDVTKAMEYWRQFTRQNHPVRLKDGVEVFLRANGTGFYAVDTGRPSTINRHHGCLMLSRQSVPADFDPALSHTRAWMGRHMEYVCGDYDLYGVIDTKAIDRKRGVNVQHVMQESVLGTRNKFTARTHEVQDDLNRAIGCDVVRHGEQVAEKFTADEIYVFDPNGGKWVIHGEPSDAEMPGFLVDLFRYVFATEIR